MAPRFGTISGSFHGCVVIAACAAVLLTSFSDEVLLASAALTSSSGSEVEPVRNESDGAELFPDLSRQIDDERGGFYGGSGPAGRLGAAERTTRHALATERLLAALPRPLRALLCVWLI